MKKKVGKSKSRVSRKNSKKSSGEKNLKNQKSKNKKNSVSGLDKKKFFLIVLAVVLILVFVFVAVKMTRRVRLAPEDLAVVRKFSNESEIRVGEWVNVTLEVDLTELSVDELYIREYVLHLTRVEIGEIYPEGVETSISDTGIIGWNFTIKDFLELGDSFEFNYALKFLEAGVYKTFTRSDYTFESGDTPLYYDLTGPRTFEVLALPSDEVCDGEDNDEDGEIDEGDDLCLTIVPHSGGPPPLSYCVMGKCSCSPYLLDDDASGISGIDGDCDGCVSAHEVRVAMDSVLSGGSSTTPVSNVGQAISSEASLWLSGENSCGRGS